MGFFFYIYKLFFLMYFEYIGREEHKILNLMAAYDINNV